MQDLTLPIEDGVLNIRAIGVIIKGHKVLLSHHTNGIYTFPGGRIHAHEDSKQAVLREIKEEIGCDAVVLRLLYIHENFYDKGPSNRHHEYGFYYQIQVNDESIYGIEEFTKNSKAGSEHKFEWCSFDKIKTIDLRPSRIKRQLLLADDEIQHIIDYNNE